MGSLLNRCNYYPATWAAGCDVCRIYLHVQRVDAVVQGDYHGWRQWKPNYTAHNYILMWHWTSCWWRCVVKQPKPRCVFFIYFYSHPRCSPPFIHQRCSPPFIHQRCSPPFIHQRCSPPFIHQRCLPPFIHQRCSPPFIHQRCSSPFTHQRCLLPFIPSFCLPPFIQIKSIFIVHQHTKHKNEKEKNDVWAQEATFKINKSIK